MGILKAKDYLITIFLITLGLITIPGHAKQYASTNEATEIIELYTSEGCSSCPPADQWLSTLQQQPELFQQFIPMSFHVDYWNKLGWKDRFSKPVYTSRQQLHHQIGNISQVYTPGVLVNNREWRGWRFGSLSRIPDDHHQVGRLVLDYNSQKKLLSVHFNALYELRDKSVLLNVAILGMGLSTKVVRGENKGRVLKHDFVVLSMTEVAVHFDANKQIQRQLAMPDIPQYGQQKNVLVVWLSDPESLNIIQAVGGYL